METQQICMYLALALFLVVLMSGRKKENFIPGVDSFSGFTRTNPLYYG